MQKEVHLPPNRKHEAGGQHDEAQRRLDEATKKEAPKWLVPQRNASRKTDIPDIWLWLGRNKRS